MRRLIDTECRQVCELQHKHKQCTESKVAKRTGEAGREREKGFGGLPRLRYDTAHPREQQAQRSGERGGGSGSASECRAAHRAYATKLERKRLKKNALGTPAKPPRDVPRNALLCSFNLSTGGGWGHVNSEPPPHTNYN